MSTVVKDPLEQAAAALAADPATAERIARAVLARQPADPRPKLILASALRRQGRAGEALPILVPLAQAFPRAARTRFELGLVLGVLGRGAAAARELDEAVRLDPAHRESWQAVADAAFAAGDALRERQALAVVARLDAADPQLGQAAELVALGQHGAAEPLLQRLCLTQPDNAEAFRLMAACQVAARATHQAEVLLRHAMQLNPDDRRIRFDLAHALYAGRQGGAALAALAPLLVADPANPAYRNLQAACLALLGDDAAAEAIHAELAAAFPDNASVAVNHGHAARTAGHRDVAIAAYRRAIELAPQRGEAWWSLANLKVGNLTATDEAAIVQQLAARPSADDRMHLEYALARRLEDDDRPAEAFPHYAAGAAIARARIGAEARDYATAARDTAALYTSDLLATRQGQGAASPAPIFIVGLPRSGSTLVEQILASHPEVEGTMELPYIGAIAGRIEREGGANRMLGASPADLRAWGEEYLALAAPHRRLGRPRFIDKMPNNFRHIGLIRLILPQARIVDVRRHPMAACFSVYKQLFAEGQDFSYDFGDLGQYYRHYLAIVRHFARVQPGAVHTLLYEDLVEETDRVVRALLAAVGLPFDPACLRFFENDRAVRTVSSEQVRQPIYRSGLDHWRAFEPWLGPLATALDDAIDTWRETDLPAAAATWSDPCN